MRIPHAYESDVLAVTNATTTIKTTGYLEKNISGFKKNIEGSKKKINNFGTSWTPCVNR